MVISTFASVPVEAITQVATPPPWFQLYVQTDRGFTRDLCNGQKLLAAGSCVSR